MFFWLVSLGAPTALGDGTAAFLRTRRHRLGANHKNQHHHYSSSCLLPSSSSSDSSSLSSILCRGHSHNDYYQQRPLWSALQHGLTSIEVDVFLKHNQLWVAHTVFELDPHQRMDNLYLKPLLRFLQGQEMQQEQHYQRHQHPEKQPKTMVQKPLRGGSHRRRNDSTTYDAVSSDDTEDVDVSAMRSWAAHQSRESKRSLLLLDPSTPNTLNLLVDFKGGDAERTARLLNQVLEPLHPYLSRQVIDHDKNNNGGSGASKHTFQRGRVTVLVSGNRPPLDSPCWNDERTGHRYLFVDGRKSDLYANQGRGEPTAMVPMISIPWHTVQMHAWLASSSPTLSSFASSSSSSSSLSTSCRSTITSRATTGVTQQLRQWAAHAHAQGKILRVWGAPNQESTWREMLQGHVDLLSIDDHPKFVRFASSFLSSS
ncbi:hypothetical protein ACA910_004417 [Epithemia clementina (nom. ined.)]